VRPGEPRFTPAGTTVSNKSSHNVSYGGLTVGFGHPNALTSEKGQRLVSELFPRCLESLIQAFVQILSGNGSNGFGNTELHREERKEIGRLTRKNNASSMQQFYGAW
jgi:hypothetical protein